MLPWFQPLQKGQPVTNLCRCALGGGCFLTLVLASLVVSYVSTRARSWPDASKFMLDPAAAAASIGAVTICTSLVGVLGAATTGRLALIFYIFLVVTSVSLTLYLSVLCFLSANTSTKLAAVLASYVSAASDFGGSVTHALVVSGSVSVVVAAVMLASAACAARVAGFIWTRTKMPALLNVVNFVLSILLLAMASFAVSKQGTDNTVFAVVVGVSSTTGSLFGALAVRLRWPRCLCAHATSALLSGFLGALTASACIAAGNVRAQNCPAGGECELQGRLSADRLLLLGAYAVIASGALFAEAAFVLHELMSPAEKKLAPGQNGGLAYDQFVGEQKTSEEQA